MSSTSTPSYGRRTSDGIILSKLDAVLVLLVVDDGVGALHGRTYRVLVGQEETKLVRYAERLLTIKRRAAASGSSASLTNPSTKRKTLEDSSQTR